MFNLINNYASVNSIVKPAIINYQAVRWATKPRWVPKAKTKIFRVPQRPDIPKDEHEELIRLTKLYKTKMKSIRKLIEDTYAKNVTSQEVLDRQAKEAEEDWNRRVEINNQWNAIVAAERDQRLAIQYERENQEILKQVKEFEEKHARELAEVNEKIRKEKELSKTYITRENIDEAIEYSLNNMSDFNYAIDLQYNIHYGDDASNERVVKQDIKEAAEIS